MKEYLEELDFLIEDKYDLNVLKEKLNRRKKLKTKIFSSGKENQDPDLIGSNIYDHLNMGIKSIDEVQKRITQLWNTYTNSMTEYKKVEETRYAPNKTQRKRRKLQLTI